MIQNLIEKSYSDIFEKLYKITNGNVILSGSLSLKYQNIINRTVTDLDVNILNSDWDKYKSSIYNHFRVYPNFKIKYGILDYDVYTCFDKITKLNEFHLFVNYSDNIYTISNGIRLLKAEYHKIDKTMIYESGQDAEKHLNDLNHINKFLNV